VTRLRQAPLLRAGDALAGAHALAVGVLAGSDLRLAEMDTIHEGLRSVCRKECHLELGTVLDGQFEGRIELVALAFESWTQPGEGAAPESALVDVAERVTEPPAPAGGGRGRTGRSSKLGYVGRFKGVEPTVQDGVVLDTPTYQRRQIVLER
jgi:hypothetical protein